MYSVLSICSFTSKMFLNMVTNLLSIVLPSLFVFLAGYAAVYSLLKNDAERRRNEIAMANQKVTTPIRLQAYERLVLYLERISPESLVVRVNQPGLNVKRLQSAMLSAIRAEWEHNLSQQLYVSKESWSLVRNAKGNVLKLISVCADKVDPEDDGVLLAQKILEVLVELDEHPTTAAIDFMKKEVAELF